jgi:hypothetical protein
VDDSGCAALALCAIVFVLYCIARACLLAAGVLGPWWLP